MQYKAAHRRRRLLCSPRLGLRRNAEGACAPLLIADANSLVFTDPYDLKHRIGDDISDPDSNYDAEPLIDAVVYPDANADQQCYRNPDADGERHVDAESDDLYEPLGLIVADAIADGDADRFANELTITVAKPQ